MRPSAAAAASAATFRSVMTKFGPCFCRRCRFRANGEQLFNRTHSHGTYMPVPASDINCFRTGTGAISKSASAMGVAPSSTSVQRAYVHPCVRVRAEYKFLSGRALVNIEQHPAAAGGSARTHSVVVCARARACKPPTPLNKNTTLHYENTTASRKFTMSAKRERDAIRLRRSH